MDSIFGIKIIIAIIAFMVGFWLGIQVGDN